MRLLSSILLCLFSCLCWSQETAPEVAAPEIKDSVQVSILGYHDFSETRPVSQMLIKTSKFRQQMQMIKDLDLPVISLADFIAWKKGEKTLPQNCILITIDDGWKSTYTDAYPILKEFGYPFTLFLYTAYIDGGGRALKTPMIKEMLANGATVASHSITHPRKSAITKQREKGPEDYTLYLNAEMGESRKILQDKFGQDVKAYAYPGGVHTEEMYARGKDLGYEVMFTVVPGKVRIDTKNELLNRYIIFGNADSIFHKSITFLGSTSIDSLMTARKQTTPFPVSPQPGSISDKRLPDIIADLSSIKDLDPDSLSLQVGGFGKVAASFDKESKRLLWKVNRPLRLKTCDVIVRYRLNDSESYEKPVKWTFGVDLEASYLPRPQ